MGLTLSIREIFLLGSAAGWVICACCFILIPSWRARDVRRMSTREIVKLLSECADEMKFRAPAGAFDELDRWIEGLSEEDKKHLAAGLRDDSDYNGE